jgi:hypothetical protein
MLRGIVLSMAIAFAACSARKAPLPVDAGASKIRSARCADLIPVAEAEATLGHVVRYKGARHLEGRFEMVSCENETKTAREVFAFDVACGGGARERFVTLVRATERAIRQTEPKVGDEAWASPNVYLSWHANVSCYTTVLLSWRRPQPDWLQQFARRLASFVLASR